VADFSDNHHKVPLFLRATYHRIPRNNADKRDVSAAKAIVLSVSYPVGLFFGIKDSAYLAIMDIIKRKNKLRTANLRMAHIFFSFDEKIFSSREKKNLKESDTSLYISILYLHRDSNNRKNAKIFRNSVFVFNIKSKYF